MAEYQQLVIDQFTEQNREQRLNPRKTNNLPVEIIGKGAFWRNPGPSPQGNARPSSYHVTIDDTDYPIEFVNKQWCYLIWDDEEKFKGYWVKPSNLIPQGQHSLGWIGNQPEIATPTALSQYRERAESTSTQGEQLSPKKESPVDDDGIDINPFQTELLAQAFTENPVFHDIAKSVDPAQSREHYLPTTVPWTERLRPTHINPQPIHARATTSGETIAATTEATKLITNAIKIDWGLKGRAPEPFNRDRTKAEQFLVEFKLFWMNNEENSYMKNPYKPSTYFLSLCAGEQVEDWVIQQVRELKEKMTRRSDLIAKTEEELWKDLIKNFVNAYTWTGKTKQAHIELAKLEMKEDNIDKYIAKFENLLRKGEIPWDDVATLFQFKEGLRKGVHAAILKRDTWPTTLDKWQQSARREVRRFGIMKESLGESGNYNLSTKQAKWKTAA